MSEASPLDLAHALFSYGGRVLLPPAGAPPRPDGGATPGASSPARHPPGVGGGAPGAGAAAAGRRAAG